MTSKETIKAAKKRKEEICASLPDREDRDNDACKWAMKEAKHWVIFLDETNRIYSLVVKGSIKRSVRDTQLHSMSSVKVEATLDTVVARKKALADIEWAMAERREE
jgi:hypothetical protein